MTETPEQTLARLTREREELHTREDAAIAPQRVADLTRVIELETENGPDRVKVVKARAIKGLPTLAIFRAPTVQEVKRFRSRLEGGPDGKGNPTFAAEELADSCLLYPEKAVFEEMCTALPGYRMQCGNHAGNLGVGVEAAEGKG